MAHAGSRYEEAYINYYEEQLCDAADTVYRMALALTLNVDSAKRCLEDTFRSLAEDLTKVRLSDDPSITLLAACWHTYNGLKSSGKALGREQNMNLTAVFKGLAAPARAALMAVDVIGVAAQDAALAFDMEILELRRHLAAGRSALLAASL